MLTSLPIQRWSRLLSTGTLRVAGRLDQALECGGQLLPAGPTRLELVFEGGHTPRLTRVRVAPGPAADEILLPLDASIEPLIALLWDVAVEATGAPEQGLALTLAPDLRLALEPGVRVTVSGATLGAPDALRLVRPLVVGFGGDGVRFEHDGYRRLSLVASVRLQRACLEPDGRVRLEGRGPPLLDAAVQRGLGVASQRVTRLVRDGRRLRSLRPFLAF